MCLKTLTASHSTPIAQNFQVPELSARRKRSRFARNHSPTRLLKVVAGLRVPLSFFRKLRHTETCYYFEQASPGAEFHSLRGSLPTDGLHFRFDAHAGDNLLERPVVPLRGENVGQHKRAIGIRILGRQPLKC